jgi:hypothetical protein
LREKGVSDVLSRKKNGRRSESVRRRGAGSSKSTAARKIRKILKEHPKMWLNRPKGGTIAPS